MRKTLSIILSALASILTANADEGMWLPSLISQRIGDMQAKGFRLSAEDIYSINQASLKDAVVLFGRGCTGELISGDGLLLTNHHCGYGQIQKHSSVEHDYLKDGFWAMKRSEELPNEGLTVSFLERMEDVTPVILNGYDPSMQESERAELVRRNSQALIESITGNDKTIRATVEALYYGNQYFLFVYREYSDIRLVGAPPSSIGKFGGETDNWMWPRHTGDFSLFRIYADKDNNPAEYSPDNVPFKPKKHFRISTASVKEGDFTFIYGFPGSTQEYIHSEWVRFISEVSDPDKVALRTLRLDIFNKYMNQSQAVRIQYSAKKARVANAWKKWQGEAGGIIKMKTVETKKAYEKAFSEWAKGTEYEGLTDKIAEICRKLAEHQYLVDFYMETVRAFEAASFAGMITRDCLPDGKGTPLDMEKFKKHMEAFFKDYHKPVDQECFAALMEAFDNKIPDAYKPDYFTEKMKEYGSAEAWAEFLLNSTIYTDRERMNAIGENDGESLLNDPVNVYYEKMTEWIMPHSSKAKQISQDLQLAYRDYMRGQMEYADYLAAKGEGSPEGSKAFYPDANLTLRVAYGHIKGYSPYDGAYYRPSSTLKGIIEKDNPEIFDYNIPQSLRDIYASKDFGRWTDADGEVPVCFIATNHTTGGNSGSPVINADGDLIGINFDRVWEGTMSDIDFDPDFCRNISLDVRYVLFTIEKIGNAGYLFDEMTFTE
jgi:hypothetical protein